MVNFNFKRSVLSKTLFSKQTLIHVHVLITAIAPIFHVKKRDITKTYLCNLTPLKPHFCIVKLGLTGVYNIFSYFY